MNGQLPELYSTLFGCDLGSGARLPASGQPSTSRRRDEDAASSSLDDEGCASCDIFTVPGVDCVGCLLGTQTLRDVDAFVAEQALTTQPRALWKLAAALYKERIVAPAERRGIRHPGWSADEIRIHYNHHSYHPEFGAVCKLRELRGVRELIVRRLIREDEEGGLDPDMKSTEQYLKVCAAEQKETQMLMQLRKGNASKASSGSLSGMGRAAGANGSSNETGP